MKPRIKRIGFICRCATEYTIPGYGVSVSDAYYKWLFNNLLNATTI